MASVLSWAMVGLAVYTQGAGAGDHPARGGELGFLQVRVDADQVLPDLRVLMRYWDWAEGDQSIAFLLEERRSSLVAAVRPGPLRVLFYHVELESHREQKQDRWWWSFERLVELGEWVDVRPGENLVCGVLRVREVGTVAHSVSDAGGLRLEWPAPHHGDSAAIRFEFLLPEGATRLARQASCDFRISSPTSGLTIGRIALGPDQAYCES